MPFPILKNVPIQEALIDFQVSFSKDLSLDALLGLYPRIKDNFPIQDKKFKWTTGFQIKDEAAQISQPSGGQIGYIFKSDDNTKVLQVSLEGFTFNKLPPYGSWAQFSEEAKSLWELFVSEIKPIKINRLDLRYINRIEIPMPVKDLKDYILTCPQIAPDVPNSVTNMLMKLDIALNDIEAFAIITESLGQPVQGQSTNKLPLIFDIDVFKITNLEPMNPKVWSYLEELRIAKNTIFFKSLSDKTLELLR